MKNSTSIQYTLRGLPERLDRRLREEAAAYGTSLNQATLDALARGLGLEDTPEVHHDLDDLAGTWVEDPAFDEAVRNQRTIDPDLWS